MLSLPATGAAQSAATESEAPTQTQLQAPAPQTLWDRPLGIVLAAGLHTGVGGGLRLGQQTLGLELVGAWQPLLAITDYGTTDQAFYAGSSFLGAAEVTLMPWHPRPWSAIGLKGGYRYNSVLGHGFGIAIAFMAALSDSLAVEVAAGASVFPGQEGALRDHLEVPQGRSISYGSNAQFFEYGLELVWYP